jgi:hypothetical protein
MSAVSTDVTASQAFAVADQASAKIKDRLAAEKARTMTHAEIEADFEHHGKELLRWQLETKPHKNGSTCPITRREPCQKKESHEPCNE